ncbi:hypothetical protein MS3_00011024 [Schistosoma haematobium]|uniref:Uncharacterized protein n=1 Tax=Schistosoma haematobium TaxID=6185 RepID=A0A922LF68_SCHHA|nr:hypothetical protein MS3_00011024 [Schistosoma haematobium]KAH9581156.1 hypothetical protein MS3_00011024 [Schistosoma haematobium]
MDIIYSWCIIWCLLNLNLNGKIGQAQEDSSTEDPITDNTTMTSTTSDFNSTTDDTNYTTIPSYSSTDIITNDATNLKCQRIFYMIVGLISLMAIN